MAKRAATGTQASLLDLETDAIVDLGARVRRVRRRVLLPALVAYVVVGHLSVAAHVLGYLPILGLLADGSYLVSKFTVLVALLLPSVPIAGPAAIVYVVLRGRVRAVWAREYRARGLTDEVLARNAGRYG
jgi:ABC-type spermidine/putrescine transport system permease subunit I